MITAKTTPLYLEQKLAEVLGLTRDQLRHVRRDVLKKKRDWTLLARQAVISKDGVDRIVEYLQHSSNSDLTSLDLSSCLFVSAAEKKERPLDAALVLLTVESRYPNTRLLRATDPNGARVDVRVTSNINFRPRMTLRGRLVKQGVYELEGRCPRFPGRY